MSNISIVIVGDFNSPHHSFVIVSASGDSDYYVTIDIPHACIRILGANFHIQTPTFRHTSSGRLADIQPWIKDDMELG